MNIICLIAKDLRLQRSFIVPLVLLELAGYTAYALQMPSEIPGVAFGLLHGVTLIGDFLICYRTMIAEEKNRALMFIKTLPVSTAEIVIAKFGANLLLVCLNTAVMLALWGSGHAFGWIQVSPVLTVSLIAAGITLHCLNNAFFVAISLAFNSERAIWVPFPAIFILMSVLVNLHRIIDALSLQDLAGLLQRQEVFSLFILWLVIAGFAAGCSWVLGHKRVFA
jgi:hypothetical protein